MRPLFLRPALLAALGIAALAGACAPLRSHQGYIIDADLVNSVRPGIDNRQSVLATLGKPSFASQFGAQDWYYVARDSRNYAFRNPHPVGQVALRIGFDAAGNVATIRKGSLEQIASVSPDSHTTPTLGRKRGFFQDLFGNIGTVGAGGVGPGAGGGAGHDTP
ncbi:outer membrane protein assembly factor BamE [Sphingomonas bacterium]|uniref:outer membrane protein assembly factor BamE n=1 Tax=Sphingomonas bacterium TaxID=1895847 RepID=UPI001576B3D7|nr:outer membrane protein assembly factor BamE [Sphingomonas bacterium]